jgi:hypothetical protein
MRKFKYTHFHGRALLFRQRLWQGHGAANVGSAAAAVLLRVFERRWEKSRVFREWPYHALIVRELADSAKKGSRECQRLSWKGTLTFAFCKLKQDMTDSDLYVIR